MIIQATDMIMQLGPYMHARTTITSPSELRHSLSNQKLIISFFKPFFFGFKFYCYGHDCKTVLLIVICLNKLSKLSIDSSTWWATVRFRTFLGGLLSGELMSAIRIRPRRILFPVKGLFSSKRDLFQPRCRLFGDLGSIACAFGVLCTSA